MKMYKEIILFLTLNFFTAGICEIIYEKIDVTDTPTFFTSPYYPRSFDHQTQKIWNLVAPEGRRIVVQIIQIRMSIYRNQCTNQYLEIADGTWSSPSTTKQKYCGVILPPKILSHGDYMSVYLNSNSKQKSQVSRFRAVCKLLPIRSNIAVPPRSSSKINLPVKSPEPVQRSFLDTLYPKATFKTVKTPKLLRPKGTGKDNVKFAMAPLLAVFGTMLIVIGIFVVCLHSRQKKKNLKTASSASSENTTSIKTVSTNVRSYMKPNPERVSRTRT